MASKRKLFLKALNNPRGLRFEEFTALVEAFGFKLLRISGSHHIYAHPRVVETANLQPVDGMAKAYQVRQVLRMIERHGLKLEDDS